MQLSIILKMKMSKGKYSFKVCFPLYHEYNWLQKVQYLEKLFFKVLEGAIKVL